MGITVQGIIKNKPSRLKLRFTPVLTINAGEFKISIDPTFLLLVPACLWAIATIYVPMVDTEAASLQPWAVSAVIVLFMFISLFLHSLAHVAEGKASRTSPPNHIYLSPLGDPAHSQPAAPSSGKEALAAFAGPLMNCMLAVPAFYLWNLQINTFTSAVALFLAFFNLALAALNLTPAFPFDGGRILRAASWKITGRPKTATRVAEVLGWIFSAGLIIWGIILLMQKARFSTETATVTFMISALIITSLMMYKQRKWEQPEPKIPRSIPSLIFRSSLVLLLMLPLMAIAVSLVPLNQGLRAPGITASVDSMIELPEQYRHDSSGKLIITTVIPQAPILFGEWVYAHIDRSIVITPPEEVVPANKTVQSTFREDHRMLLDSETTAIIVGMRMAGYPAEIINSGVRIISILSQSPAEEVLRPDDIITGIGENAITSPAELTDHLKFIEAGGAIDMKIKRDGMLLDLSVPAIYNQAEKEAVRIGIAIEPYTSGYNLPFPVKIVSKKINGGPSAGLMFTLGIYDLLTEGDLTGGRKIAGTGTISMDGKVGAIGGIEQKVVAVERAGAEYFLVPEENYEAAAAVARHVNVIKVRTIQEAIDFLDNLSSLPAV